MYVCIYIYIYIHTHVCVCVQAMEKRTNDMSEIEELRRANGDADAESPATVVAKSGSTSNASTDDNAPYDKADSTTHN